jgi:hypothetical protein
MLGRGICEKYQSRDEQFPFMQHQSVELNRYIMLGPENDKQKVLFI